MSSALKYMRNSVVLAAAVIAASVVVPVALGSGAPCNNGNWCTVETVRASVGDGWPGTEGKWESHDGAISADGRYVAFAAKDDFGSDGNTWYDVYVRDVLQNDTILVSLSAAGDGAGNDFSRRPSLSSDGRVVAFDSAASDIVGPGGVGGADTNGVRDVFFRDMAASTTTRASLSSAGAEADKSSLNAVISADGTHVAFKSYATNLVENDHNTVGDVFVRDLKNGTTERVSVGDEGQEAKGESEWATISADGRYVAFASQADNLVPNDTNGVTDVFLRDRTMGTTILVTATKGGAESGSWPSISGDGRFVAFESSASAFVDNDANGTTDVFLRDMDTGAFTRLSENVNGGDAGGASSRPSISADGGRVAFESDAPDLVPPGTDTNGALDVFVRDIPTATTTIESLTHQDKQANGMSIGPALAGDGKHVAFDSLATNLVPNDTNMQRDVFLRWL